MGAPSARFGIGDRVKIPRFVRDASLQRQPATVGYVTAIFPAQSFVAVRVDGDDPDVLVHVNLLSLITAARRESHLTAVEMQRAVAFHDRLGES